MPLAMSPETASCDWSTKSLRLRDSCDGLMEACGGEVMSYCVGGEVNDPPYGEVDGDANCGYDMGGEPLVMD